MTAVKFLHDSHQYHISAGTALRTTDRAKYVPLRILKGAQK